MLKSLLSIFLLFASASGIMAAEKPNFVIIFIDDMGYGDTGPFGSELNPTPNLDRMAEEGMKLTSFYAAPVCSASRAQLLTGSYAPRVSVPGVFFPAGENGLNPEEHTIADYLGELGYATMAVGKWHLGDQREFLPTNNGFDGYYGIPYSNDMGRTSVESGKRVHPIMRDTEVDALIEDEEQRMITRQFTEEALKFMEENAEDPFFLYLPHSAVHVPIYPHPDFAGTTKNGAYGDWIAEVDWSVGQVLDALRRLDLEKETLVLFTSDNGPWASRGENGGVSGPLRGSKGGTLEGGVRVPTIAWWPERIAAGQVTDEIAGTTDILPTFVSLAGGELREDVRIDGVDLSALLLGKSMESPRDHWYYFQGRNLQAVRSGPWKLALTAQSIGMGFKDQPEDIRSAGRLYNLEEKVGELTNLADQNPDVVARLEAMAATMTVDMQENVRPAGSVENPVTLYPTVPRAPRKPSKPVDWKKAKLGDVFRPDAAPNVSKQPFEISCQIEGEALSGVILAHGGSAVGHSLYVRDNKVVFAVRTSSDEPIRVEAPLEDGSSQIKASLAKNGQLSLTVNGGAAVTAMAPGLLNRHPQEDLCIGHDNKNPVDSAAPKEKFKGTLKSVSMQIGKP